jgi:predicted Zn finger-like uncharacterized protein
MAADNEIHLICRKCSTMYRLDPAHLAGGRMVRCTACREEWYQMPPQNGIVPGPLDVPPVIAEAAPPAEPQPTQRPEWEEDPKDDLTFKPANKGEYFLEDDMRVIPESVMPDAVMPDGARPGELSAGAITHKPMGMGAGAFGLFIFLFLFCATFSSLLVFREKIVERYPPMLTLYKAVGVGVEAPGQGLTFSVMTAEHRIEKEKHTLAINVKLSNISDHEAPYPSFRVAVRDATGGTLQKWDFIGDKSKKIASGDSVPVPLIFHNPPEDAKTAEITVTAD